MDRVDRLLNKAKPRDTIHSILERNNPYLQMTYEELKEYMRYGSGKEHPKTGTIEHTKYMYALLQARAKRKR